MTTSIKNSIQFAILILIIVFLVLVFHNAQNNLQDGTRLFDFNFLNNRAGFAISQTLIPYNEDSNYWRVFWVGLANTLLIAFLATITATLLGTFIGILRLSSNWLIRQLATAYIDIFRNIPLLLQLFFWFSSVLLTLSPARNSDLVYGCDINEKSNCLVALNNRGLSLIKPYWNDLLQQTLLIAFIAIIISIFIAYFNKRRQINTGKYLRLGWLYSLMIIILPTGFYYLNAGVDDYSLPSLQGFNYHGGLVILPELLALWIALTLYSASYIAEYVRSGIQSVDKGQTEAASALGMTPWQIMKLVVLPQSLRVIIPPLTNQFINILKNSSLATAIAYPDLVSVFTGTTLNQTGRAVEIIFMTMSVYLLLSLIIALIMTVINRHYQIKVR